MPSGWTTGLPADVLLDQGLLYINGALVGATKDGLRFDPRREIRNLPFAGQRSPIAGGDRVIRWAPIISGTLIELGTTEIALIEPGAALVSGGGISTWTPADASVLIPSANLLSNVRAVWPRGGGGFADVKFLKGLILSWSIESADADEVSLAIEIEARLDMTVGGATTDDCPYVVRHIPAVDTA